MTIEISDGVTVTVNVPNRMSTICPATTPGGPITVPVQGSLTAEQFAHIVTTVTAKVVEELGGQPGNVSWEAVQGKPAAFPPEAHRHNAADIDDLPSGGGAGIDDATIGTDTTWSSQKTSDELAGKANFNASVTDPETGEVIEVGPLNDVVMSLATLLSMAAIWNDADNGFPVTGTTYIVSELPSDPTENTMYFVRQTDGTCVPHLPILREPSQGPGGAP